MKKVISAGLLMLVASLMFSGMPMAAEAQTDLTILVKIAFKAQNEVEQQISSSSSDEINQLFREASQQVVLLEKSAEGDDPSSAKQHFLSAMKMFKRITQMISSDSPTQELQATDAASTSTQGDYDSNLERIKKYISSLKSIARSESISFEKADILVAQAEKQFREHDKEGLEETIKELKEILTKIHKDLRNQTSQTTDNRTIQFFKTMLDRLVDRNADPDSIKDARDLLSDYEQQIADGNDDEAQELKKKLTKLIRELYNATS